jgi:phage tail-like protein
MATASRPDPYVNARFRVEIDGLPVTGAREIIFPEARIVRYAKRKPVVDYGRLTLRRGMTTSSGWFQWWERARQSAPRSVRRAVTVVLMDASGADVMRWAFSDAQPTGYGLSPLNAMAAEPLIETLELSVRGWKMG